MRILQHCKLCYQNLHRPRPSALFEVVLKFTAYETVDGFASDESAFPNEAKSDMTINLSDHGQCL